MHYFFVIRRMVSALHTPEFHIARAKLVIKPVPQAGHRKNPGTQNGELAGGSKSGAPESKKNGAPEMRGPGRCAGRGENKTLPRTAPRCGVGRGFFAGPRQIRGPARPGANTKRSHP